MDSWAPGTRKEAPKINGLKVPELKKMLQDRGLCTAGLKADLVKRLKAAIESSGGDSSNGEESEDSIGEDSEEELENGPWIPLENRPGYPWISNNPEP
jgi:hypothetical protein